MSNNTSTHASIAASVLKHTDFTQTSFELLASNLTVSTVEDKDKEFTVVQLKNVSDINITFNSGDINGVFVAELIFAVNANDACVGTIDIADTKPIIKLNDKVLSTYPSKMRCDDSLKLELLANAFDFDIKDDAIPIELKLKQAIVKQLNDMLQEAIEKEDEDCFIVQSVKELTAEAIDSSSSALNQFLSTHQG